MEGYGSDIGVSPRAIDELFRIINGSTEDWSYSVRSTFFEFLYLCCHFFSIILTLLLPIIIILDYF